ncbi:MAG: (d)CMP kinase [Chloroflexota bacterium]
MTASVPSAITIDGPAAAGKSVLGEKLAQRLDYLYFDTGVMYRAITWLALQRQIDVADEVALTRLAETVRIGVARPEVDDGRQYTVSVDSLDITWEIRRPEVDQNVSAVSAYEGVRRAMAAQQRAIGIRGQVVMVGRDIGTVVLPEADLKLYLTASPEERARRRWKEIQARGQEAGYQQVLEDMRRRDKIDSEREIAPLRPAADAVVINNDHLTVEEEVRLVERLILNQAV